MSESTSAWQMLWDILTSPPHQQQSAEVREWLAHNAPVAAQFHHQQYGRPCTCHPSEAPVPCERRYAFSECMEQRRWRNFWCMV